MLKLADQLKEKGVDLEEGLSIQEVERIEKEYNIQFSQELKELFMAFLPVSNGFYNWRDFSKENINQIKQIMLIPEQDIQEDIEDIEWNDGWGKEPSGKEERASILRKKLREAPRLIPISSHRYTVSIRQSETPIFSIHGSDIICYGGSFKEYLEIEFGEKPYSDISIEKAFKVPFWGEIL